MKPLLVATALVLFSVVSPLSAGESRCASSPNDSVVTQLLKQAPGLRGEVLRLALGASRCAAEKGLVKRDNLLTVIDYSIPSTEPRLFTFDLVSKTLVFRELVAHGKNSGGNVPEFFSNANGSLATSLGLFVTGDTYVGSNGYSLRLRGLEKGVNDRAMERAVVMHGAPYVSRSAIKALGRLGRSWGCPAVRKDIARKMIDTLRGGSPIFAYYPDRQWLAQSAFVGPVKGAGAGSRKIASR